MLTEPSSLRDPLTGLPNRTAFERRCKEAIAALGTTSAFLCFIDLDNFKPVNDTAGHGAGDELLRQVGQLFKNALRQEDMVARIGGDEFALVIYADEAAAFASADRLLASVQRFRFLWREKSFRIGASIGMLRLQKGMSFEEALAAADAACYQAKEKGRGRIVVAKPDDKRLTQQRQWAERLKEAARQRRVEAGRVVRRCPDGIHTRFETRVRCENGSYASPASFIPAAERSGMMPMLDIHSAQEAARVASEGAPVIVRLHPATFKDETAMEEIEQLLAPVGELVTVEVSEQTLLGSLSTVTRWAMRLRGAGCGLGISSFSTIGAIGFIRSLTPSVVGIDHAFTGDLDDEVHRSVVESLIHVAHAIGAQAMCSEVQDETALARLSAMGADCFEGPIF